MKKVLVPLLILTLILGGCFNMGQSDSKDNTGEEKPNNNESENDYEKENFIPVQDYTGQGYTLRDANSKTGEIAKAHRDEVEKAVQQFFKDTYKTDVKVHNIVSAKDGVSVFVESIGEPHFYTFAIVPVDIKNEEVETDKVWSQEGQVEYAIKGGLYAMAFEDEFENLDHYLEKMTGEYPITGKPMEAVANVGGNGYANSYYFISPAGKVFEDLYQLYEKSPDVTKDELKSFFNKNNIDPDYINFGIKLYMEEGNAEPDMEIYDKIYSDIKDMDNIPDGEYYITLNDNNIDRKRADGKKDNSIDKTVPDGIVKNGSGKEGDK